MVNTREKLDYISKLLNSLEKKGKETEVAQSCLTLCDLWTVAHQAPPSMGFSRQEYWSGLPLVLMNWHFQTMVLEKTLESPLESKEIQLVNLKGNQPWVLFGRTDAEAEAPILWSPDVKSWLVGKDPDAGKDWRQKEKRATEDEMVEWHYQHNGHEFE